MDVKILREKMGVTQQEFAEMCGVTVRTVQNWEKGSPIPDAMKKLIENIAKNHEIIKSGGASEHGVSVAAGSGSQVTLNPDTKQFFETLERQQDIMSRQLDELTRTRLLIEKKDEQIAELIKLIGAKQ